MRVFVVPEGLGSWKLNAYIRVRKNVGDSTQPGDGVSASWPTEAGRRPSCPDRATNCYERL